MQTEQRKYNRSLEHEKQGEKSSRLPNNLKGKEHDARYPGFNTLEMITADAAPETDAGCTPTAC
jgi:hypothetical protein